MNSDLKAWSKLFKNKKKEEFLNHLKAQTYASMKDSVILVISSMLTLLEHTLV